MKALAAVLLASTVLGAQAPGEVPELDDVLARASAYVARFDEVLTTLVAEERYEQRVTGSGFFAPGRLRAAPAYDSERRVLRSDFLLVRAENTTDWLPFRDVFEVDGNPIREREDRLMTLFVNASGDFFERAQRISNESSRYNIGPVIRTVNVPTLPLRFLEAANSRRLMFEKVGEGRVDGVPVWEIRFVEVSVPTLVRTTGNANLPAEGTFWIDPIGGGVVRGQIRLRTGGLRSEITVTYVTHESVSVRVPGELKERYQGEAFDIHGTATYGRIRQFTVTTDEVVEDEAGGERLEAGAEQ
jgi:hypothetical protein